VLRPLTVPNVRSGSSQRRVMQSANCALVVIIPTRKVLGHVQHVLKESTLIGVPPNALFVMRGSTLWKMQRSALLAHLVNLAPKQARKSARIAQLESTQMTKAWAHVLPASLESMLMKVQRNVHCVLEVASLALLQQSVTIVLLASILGKEHQCAQTVSLANILHLEKLFASCAHLGTTLSLEKLCVRLAQLENTRVRKAL